MTDVNNHRPDVLESALDALRGEPIPKGPPPDLAAATVRKLESSTESSEILRLKQRKERMLRIARYSGLSAAVVALIAVIGWFSFLNSTSTVAFADVIKNVQKAESVTMTNRQKLPGMPEITLKISIQGQLLRMEQPGRFTNIIDLKNSKSLHIMHVNKTVELRHVKLGGSRTASRTRNPLDQFRKLRPKDAERRGDEKLNGKTVYVYDISKIDFLGHKGDGELRVWVDPKTKLPLKIRFRLNSLPGSKPSDRPFDTIAIFEDMQWNKRLDPKLFEMKVPKGYKVIKGAPIPKLN